MTAGATNALPPSLYADTARERAPTRRLVGHHRTAVAVIGGGFTGLSTALHLAQRGIAVAVLEAAEPGWGASGRNGGQVNPGLKHEPEEIEQRFGRDLGARMVRLSGEAPQRVFDLVREHQIQCEADQSGTLRAAITAGSAAFLARATAQWQARGAPVDLLDRNAVARATGTERYLCAAFDRRGGSLNPLGYARGLADAATRAGAVIYGDCRAGALVQQGGGWVVETPGGSVAADWVVLATNGYTDDLWPGLRRSVVPVFSGMVATEPLPDPVARRILPGRSVLYEHEAITVYYRIDRANRLLMGGRSRMRPLEGAEGFGDLRRYAARLFPFLGQPAWSHGWNGQLAITTDHYPHLHEPAPNLIACLGYNGRGVAMATVMGEEMARRIAGVPAAKLDMPVSPMRTIPFHFLWRVGATARIAYGHVRATIPI